MCKHELDPITQKCKKCGAWKGWLMSSPENTKAISNKESRRLFILMGKQVGKVKADLVGKILNASN